MGFATVLLDIARETSKWAYENKPKTSQFSVRGKKKKERDYYTLHTHTYQPESRNIIVFIIVFTCCDPLFFLVPGLQNNMTCNTIGRGTL